MERIVGTIVRGLRAPIIVEGDSIEDIVEDVVLKAVSQGELKVRDRDVIGITEAVVARAQGNYATKDQIAADVKAKLGEEEIGLIFPILSRNRFAICLRGIARGVKKIVLMISYPRDEVGNPLMDIDLIDKTGIDPGGDILSEEEFDEAFGKPKHPFTGVDYVAYYKKLIEEEGAQVQVVYANKPTAILKYTDKVLNCDIHSRKRTKRLLKQAGAAKVVSLDEILKESVNGSGFNSKYGLLGSNKATEERVKLFPNDCTSLVNGIQQRLKEKTGKTVEVMVYGDGAFKDPQGHIWELADPVVSPGYTEGLKGTPNEVKLKYLADNNFAHLKGEELKQAISKYIANKGENLKGLMESQGTTPRQITDLIGSLCDLTSGSGDKGTPIVYIQGYFDNYTK